MADVFRGGYVEQRAFMETNAALTASATDQIVQGIAAAVQEAGRLQSRQLQAIGRVFQRGAQDGARMQTMFTDIGLAAQRSVVQSYGQLVSAREVSSYYRQSPNNPRNKRYAGGALRRALQSRSFFEATPNGLRFVNVQLLNQEAKHWHRLNFGAAPRGEGSRSQFAVEWSGIVLAALGFDEEASPSFILPRGYWIQGGERVGYSGTNTGAEFYPVGELPSGVKVHGRPNDLVRSQGIHALNFLDAGLRRIAQMLPVALQDLYREWYEEAKHGEGPLSGEANARPTAQVTRTITTRLYD